MAPFYFPFEFEIEIEIESGFQRITRSFFQLDVVSPSFRHRCSALIRMRLMSGFGRAGDNQLGPVCVDLFMRNLAFPFLCDRTHWVSS